MKKLLLLFLLLPVVGMSQEKNKDKWGWRTIASVGMISGEQATKELFQLSGGVTYNRFYVGAGVGYDPYVIRSIPIFADIRFDYLKSRTAFFYANIGISKPIDDDEDVQQGFGLANYDRSGRLYYEIGAGYKIRLGGMHKLLFSAGYSQKQIVEEKGYEWPCTTCGGDPLSNTYVYDYKFGRIIIKLSWEFGK